MPSRINRPLIYQKSATLTDRERYAAYTARLTELETIRSNEWMLLFDELLYRPQQATKTQPQTEKRDLTLSTNEVCELLQVRTSVLRRLIANGDIPVLQGGRSFRFDKTAVLEAWEICKNRTNQRCSPGVSEWLLDGQKNEADVPSKYHCRHPAHGYRSRVVVRGLCTTCYQIAGILVRTGMTTWEQLVALGKAAEPKRSFEKKAA